MSLPLSPSPPPIDLVKDAAPEGAGDPEAEGVMPAEEGTEVVWLDLAVLGPPMPEVGSSSPVRAAGLIIVSYTQLQRKDGTYPWTPPPVGPVARQ